MIRSHSQAGRASKCYSSTHTSTVASLLLLASQLVGCHHITFVNTRTPESKPVIDARLNSAIVADIVDIDGPVRMDLQCKETSWARVETRRSAFSVLVELLGGWVYSGRELTAYCAKSGTVGSGTVEPSAATAKDPGESQTPGEYSAAVATPQK